MGSESNELSEANGGMIAPTSGKAHDRISGRSIFPPVSRRSVGIPVCVFHFASLSNLVPFIPAIVSLASRTSLPWPYFAIVCHFRNTRRLNSVLNKLLECSRVLGISGTGPAAHVQPTRIGVREGRGKNGPRIAMKLLRVVQLKLDRTKHKTPSLRSWGSCQLVLGLSVRLHFAHIAASRRIRGLFKEGTENLSGTPLNSTCDWRRHLRC